MTSTYKRYLTLVQTHMHFDVVTQCGTATRSTRGGSINLVLFVTRFNNARPSIASPWVLSRASEIARYCSQFTIRRFHIPLTSLAARTVRGKTSPLRARARSLAAKLTLALCRGSAKMAKLRRILRHCSQKCLLYKVLTRYFAISWCTPECSTRRLRRFFDSPY